MSEQVVNTGASTPFAILAKVLRRYFPNPENGGMDRSAEFVTKFRQTRGTGLEFDGLLADIKAAAADPAAASALINSIVGSTFSPAQAQDHLYELHDQLAEEGVFGVEYLKEQADLEKAAKPDTDELMGYYAKRNIQLPGIFSRLSAPLWVYLTISAAIVSLSALALWAIPLTWGLWSQILRWPMVVLTAVGFGGLLASSLTMVSLRNERLHPPQTSENGAKESFLRKALRFR